MMQEGMTRIVYVIDQDEAKHQMVAQICSESNWLVGGFTNYPDFIDWFEDQCVFPTVNSFVCCFVMDIAVLSELTMRRLPTGLFDVPKIYVGTPHFNSELSKLSWMGFFDFMEKPCSVEVTREKLERALRRHEYLLSSTLGVAQRFERLSKREYEVGALVVTGMTNLEVGEKLGISIKTVKAHRARVMQKTESETLVDLVRNYDIRRKVETSRQVIPRSADRI
jgi:FixJ family two-component response regulator